jgi:hypothetical protein
LAADSFATLSHKVFVDTSTLIVEYKAKNLKMRNIGQLNFCHILVAFEGSTIRKRWVVKLSYLSSTINPAETAPVFGKSALDAAHCAAKTGLCQNLP